VKQVYLNPAGCDPTGTLFSQPFVSQNATSIQLDVTAVNTCGGTGCHVIVLGPSSTCCLTDRVILP